MKGRTASQKICWNMDAISNKGLPLKLTFVFVCEYTLENVAEQNCKTEMHSADNTKTSSKFFWWL